MINSTRYRLATEMNRQSQLAKEIANLQAQISTQKRIQAPSDDPIATARISELGRTQSDEAAWKRNIDTATGLSEKSYTALTSLMATVDRAAELIQSAANGAAPEASRAIYAAELRELADHIDSLAQTKDARGEPLFRTNPLEIPVGPQERITAVASRTAIFGPIVTADGNFDLSTILRNAATAATQVDPNLRQTAVDRSLASIRLAVNHVAAAQGDQNIRGNRIANVEERLAASGLQIAEERSTLEDTDPFAAISKLDALKTSLEAAQAVFARVNQTSLFDLLR